MKNQFTIGTRLSLVLSLAIASSLVATVVKAESPQDQFSENQLSYTISQLINLSADQQGLIEIALNRAIAARQAPANTSVTTTGAIAPAQRTIRGRIQKSVP
jgi:hypothetical protein